MKSVCSVLTVFGMMLLPLIAGTPQIKNVKAFQQYPWGKVYISYEVVGDLGESNVLGVTARDKISGQFYGIVVSGSSCLSGNTAPTPGLHEIAWDIVSQGLSINSTNVTFTVSYYPEEYLIVDLSGGASASSYPIAYMSVPPSGGFNANEYKTSKLVLRLIIPGAMISGSFNMCDQYIVTLTKAFYIGLFEVTQKQYELVTGTNPSTYKGDSHPVEGVSWNAIRGNSSTYNWPTSRNIDPSTFIGKIRARTGLGFDLPTEAQWEYACRAGTTSAYNNGGELQYSSTSKDLDKLGRYRHNGGVTVTGISSDYQYYYNGTAVVGSYLPNAWGLYDMHGNVDEWCLDWYGDLLSGVIDPLGPATGTGEYGAYRVQGGGTWNSDAYRCTSSSRDGSYIPSYGAEYDGFRLVILLSN